MVLTRFLVGKKQYLYKPESLRFYLRGEMVIDLGAVVYAEQEAERLIADAKTEYARAVAKALDDRKRALQDLSVPKFSVKTQQLISRTDKIRQVAKSNQDRAVRMVLEELHAA